MYNTSRRRRLAPLQAGKVFALNKNQGGTAEISVFVPLGMKRFFIAQNTS